MLIDKSGIARLVPHSGAMFLLDHVLRWDPTAIRCVANSHRLTDNPLRRDCQLGILCGVEYAAQAIALHGALRAGATTRSEPARIGYLASLRSMTAYTDRLDLLPGPLIVDAQRLHGDSDGSIYGFILSIQDRILLSGRAAVALIA
jgi:predicted hotdog family 3-hydroxylacyl-ACP dehydratase